MKRNKRTEKLSHQDLSPLTERILARMGLEGREIRRRLRLFYQSRRDPDEAVRGESHLRD